jgi:hypothetical protein
MNQIDRAEKDIKAVIAFARECYEDVTRMQEFVQKHNLPIQGNGNVLDTILNSYEALLAKENK